MKRHRWLILLASTLALGAVTVPAVWRIGASRQAPADRADGRGPGDLYVLSVGVEPGLTAKGKRDPYAGDAWFVRQALAQAEPLYATTHSRVLAGSRATRAGVLGALAWLGTSVGERDVAVLFFSAHGSIAPRGMAPKEGYYLDLAGAGGPEKDCVLWGSELNAALGTVRGRAVLLLDTCSAAAVIPADGPGARRAAVVASCGADESSSGQWKRADRPHGWFVIALCEALNGSADANGDGVVTLAEATSYLPARAKGFYGKQTAVVSLREPLLELPLARIDRDRPATELWPPGPRTPARDPLGRPDALPP
jgi:hypothetical protein